MAGLAQAYSPRLLVVRFAACLAHWLNASESSVVTVQAFDLYLKITRLLASKTYRDMCGAGVLVDRGAEEAANLYFDDVLQRPLFLARDLFKHKGHELFEALCRRGLAEGWESAMLARSKVTSHAPDGTPPPLDLAGVGERLSQLPQSVSAGNPAETTRASHGPLHLQVSGRAYKIAEEMSIWGAISCAPARLKRLADNSREFDGFCSLVIKAIESANAHYSALVSLGLSPADWRDLSVNTAKKASAFLSEVRRIAPTIGCPNDSLAVWREAWLERQVPGFNSVDEFWSSDLGKALNGTREWQRVSLEELQVLAEPGREERLLEALEFEGMVGHAVQSGLLSPVEGTLLRALMAGRSLEELGKHARELGLPLAQGRLSDHLFEICRRVRAHADAQAHQPEGGDRRPKPGSTEPSKSGTIPMSRA